MNIKLILGVSLFLFSFSLIPSTSSSAYISDWLLPENNSSTESYNPNDYGVKDYKNSKGKRTIKFDNGKQKLVFKKKNVFWNDEPIPLNHLHNFTYGYKELTDENKKIYGNEKTEFLGVDSLNRVWFLTINSEYDSDEDEDYESNCVFYIDFANMYVKHIAVTSCGVHDSLNDIKKNKNGYLTAIRTDDKSQWYDVTKIKLKDSEKKHSA